MEKWRWSRFFFRWDAHHQCKNMVHFEKINNFLNVLRSALFCINMWNTDRRSLIGCFEWRQCCCHSKKPITVVWIFLNLAPFELEANISPQNTFNSSSCIPLLPIMLTVWRVLPTPISSTKMPFQLKDGTLVNLFWFSWSILVSQDDLVS